MERKRGMSASGSRSNDCRAPMARYALLDPALAHMPLFRPTGRGRGAAHEAQPGHVPPLTIGDPHLGDLRLECHGPHRLGAQEEDLLLVVISLAAQISDHPHRKWRLLEAGSCDHSQQLVRLQVNGSSMGWPLLQLQVSRFLLLREVHRRHPSQGDYLRLDEQLLRLSQTGYNAWAQPGSRFWTGGGSLLLGWEVAGDAGGGMDLRITLSERLTRAVSGVPSRGGRSPSMWYTRVDLEERRALPTDAARILHRLLSARLPYPRLLQGGGKQGLPRAAAGQDYAIAGLSSRLYGDCPDTPAATVRQHWTRTRAALAALGQLPGWTVGPASRPGFVRVARVPVPPPRNWPDDALKRG